MLHVVLLLGCVRVQFYCAPEVALEGRGSMASDIWSFGVIMWWVVQRTGTRHEQCTRHVMMLQAAGGCWCHYVVSQLLPSSSPAPTAAGGLLKASLGLQSVWAPAEYVQHQ
jgi:serine/threonine protein kinase